MRRYDHLDKDALIRLLERRDVERQLGLVWERDEFEAERVLNDDFVALDLDESHSTAQHSTAQHSTAQHSTAQHSTAQHSILMHILRVGAT